VNTGQFSSSDAGDVAEQRIVKVRRDYNRWVASETLEDYALRYTPEQARVWSEWRVANTAFGAASFLVLEAVGATLLVRYGFLNAFWAILASALVIFLAGLPISVHAARHGVDMDLLTRGAGFGYIGSTITSLLYASFTFIFFALEAAVMAYALELAFGIPPTWGYLACALAVIPLVTHGIAAIGRFQVWTQPLWLLLLLLPYAAVLMLEPGALNGVMHYSGENGNHGHFDWHLFGAGLTVGVSLITQMGEQADYLRFMPAAAAGRRRRWWLAVLAGGPGWVLPGVLKMLGGALLAWLALSHMVPAERAVDPNQMYLAAWETLLPYGWAVWATALFVVVSQLKINVTNAYAGSLAWSNFFSRLTHSHPGRVVWVLFNALIALLLMEMELFQALGEVLGLYANLAIAWIMAVVADLVICKPLGWSPPGIEFRRAYLYDVNPVGVGAMGLASALSMAAHLGLFGPAAQAFSAVIAMVTALVAAPLLAWATQGRYYLARAPGCAGASGCAGKGCGEPGGQGEAGRLRRCVVCEREYEAPDTAHCPAYQGTICSLCCSLDARCGDRCKPQARLAAQWGQALRWLMPRRLWPHLDGGLAHYLLLMGVVALLLAALLGLLYRQEWRGLQGMLLPPELIEPLQLALRAGFGKVYATLLLVFAIVAWWLVLTYRSRAVAQEESNRQTGLLLQEIESHRRTDLQLQQAREVAEAARTQADQANQAKTRYISNISHELRTPLNSILGYAQLLLQDGELDGQRAHAIRVILRGGEHLLSLIEGTLDIARIESGKLALQQGPVDLRALLQEVTQMFELQAAAKGLRFGFDGPEFWPTAVRADEKRLRQILINLLGNAVKFTARGEVRLVLRYARQMATFEIIDTGPGITSSELERIFEPFARASSAASSGTPGSGLGLTIARMLAELMGGELGASSEPGRGTTFRLRLFLPELQTAPARSGRPRAASLADVIGYEGPRRRILVVDNEGADRQLLLRWLEPLGFAVSQATHGEDALAQLQAGLRPDVVFMDLAMPGMDGWETLRRIRALELQPAPLLAVVSANAFDRGLDNEVGLPPEDFLVKPVRRQELLQWLQDRLQLRWRRQQATPIAAPAIPDVATTQGLPCEAIDSLLDLARLGYYRGFVKRADALQSSYPECASWLAQLQAQAREFRFEAIVAALEQRVAAGDNPCTTPP
jgi:signal transduction histidine kinase/CheY-like chemotaxis protein